MTLYKKILITAFIALFTWSIINPVLTYHYWFLETSPILIAILVFILFGRYFKLSDTSYALIVLYLALPLIASHYGVEGVPFGKTLGHWLGTERNMYDRLEHFTFGLIATFPIRDIVLYIMQKRNFWSLYYIPLETVISLSAIYEIFEWVAAVTVNPVLAGLFYGSQGDIFDTPKDMAVATIGALIAITLTFIYHYYKKKKVPQI